MLVWCVPLMGRGIRIVIDAWANEDTLISLLIFGGVVGVAEKGAPVDL